MGHQLYLSRPIGFPDELNDPEALRRMAADRVNMALAIVTSDDPSEAQALLLDSESLLEAADAAADGMKIELGGDGSEPSISIVRDHVRSLRYALGGHTEELGAKNVRALEEMVYAIEKSLDPMAERQIADAREFLDRRCEELKAEREQEQDFSECWGGLGSMLEVKLGEDDARKFASLLLDDPSNVVKMIQSILGGEREHEEPQDGASP